MEEFDCFRYPGVDLSSDGGMEALSGCKSKGCVGFEECLEEEEGNESSLSHFIGLPDR